MTIQGEQRFGTAALGRAQGRGVVTVTRNPRLRTDAPDAAAVISFDAFYRSEYPRIVAIAQSLTGDRHVAEELAQEGFVAAHHRWKQISNYDRPGDWVRRVVTNRAISIFRRRAAERRALARQGRVTDTVELREDDAWLWQQVRALPARQAQAIALVYIDDLPLEQVASILGCAETTVKTHLHRGRQALARAIAARDQLDAVAEHSPSVPVAGSPS